MVRIRRLAAALGAFALAALTVSALAPSPAARAQTLQRLTVESFQLDTDAVNPQVDVPFHLIVTLNVRERVTAIENLQLPSLAELELLGDERALASGSRGTQYRETITVLAHHTGDYVIAPATLQAIDARDRRAKQYYSNNLRLRVVLSPAASLNNGASIAAAAGGFALRVGLWILGTLCAIAIVVLIFRRRTTVPPPPPPAVAQPLPESLRAAPAQRSARDQLRDALTVLRAERSRSAAVRVRAAVWRMVGASDGETLADVLQRPQTQDPSMRDLLRALERAAFTHDGDLQPAIDAACDALERDIES